MNKNIIGIGGGVAVVIIIAIVFGVSNLDTDTPLTKVNIGYFDSTVSLPVLVADEKGFFEKRGIDVELFPLRTSDLVADALYSDQIDVAVSISNTVALASEQKSPDYLRAFTMYTASTDGHLFSYVLVNSDSPIDETADLNGKKIAIFPSSMATVLAEIVFENMLGPDSEVELVKVSPLDWEQALATGKTDALLSYEPFGTMIIQSGVGKIISEGAWEKYVMKNIPVSVDTFSTKFYNEHPETAEAVKDALHEAGEFIINNDEEARKIMLERTKAVADEEIAMKTPLVKSEKLTKENVERFQDLADILYEKNALEKKIDVTTMLYQIP